MAGFSIEGLWISGFQRSFPLKNLLFPFKLIFSLIRAGGIIKRFKPEAVIGVGGYASGPTVKMASRKKIPTLLQEQNSFPGITNKLLAKDADKICVAYPGMEKYFPKEKLILTGNPVRQHVVDIEGKRSNALQYFDLQKNKPVVLIVGGSQGARSINEAVDENLGLFAMNNLQLIWQTGTGYTDQARKSILEKLNGNKKNLIRTKDFITKMDFAYAAADIVISRAGAIAISELSAVGLPCIFIPLPSAAEDHQTKNALALVEHDAAIYLNDSEAKAKLGTLTIELAKDKNKQQILKDNIRKMAVKDSANIIADEILQMIKKNRNAE
jgi:UDP-N-acetylglucosamine--N-acetylmuramyl-(pentapeptide) pyrophosphoryl-undecaprenol N-acetylglucosamine transferase